MGGFILECNKPLPLRGNENPNHVLLFACDAEMHGEKIWDREAIDEKSHTITTSDGQYAYEVTRRNERVHIAMKPQTPNAKGWIAVRRGNALEQITKEASVELSAKGLKRDRRFYVIEGEKENLQIRTIVYASAL